MNRPLVWVAAALAAGTYAASIGFCPGLVFPLVLCGLGVLAVFAVREPSIARPMSVVLTSFAVGALLWNVRHEGLPGDPLSRYVADRGGALECEVEGAVRLAGLEQDSPDDLSFQLDADRVLAEGEWICLEGGVCVCQSKPDKVLHAGDRVRVRGFLQVELSWVNPGASSPEDHLRRRGIHTVLYAQRVERVESGPWWSPLYWASRLRVAQARRFAQVIPESVRPFAMAVWLGHRTEISDREYQAYIESGTAHILAVSGLHVAMIFASAGFVLRVIVKNRRLRAVLIAGAVLLFALTSGARPSCLRAAVMVIVYLLADLFEREPDPPTALSISAILFLLWRPGLLFDSGTQLSFLSIASILLFASPIYELLHALPRWLRGALATTVGVQILPLPMAIHMFHVFPLAAAPANLLVVPLTTVALWLCFLTALSSMISLDVALLFGHALEPVVWLIRGIAAAVTIPRATFFRLIGPTAAAIISYYGMLVCFAAAVKFEKRWRPWAAAAVVSAVLVVALWRPLQAEPTIVFLDVDHGDSAFVRSPDGVTLLIDGGGSHKEGVIGFGERAVAPFLWSNHVSHLDYVAVSHPEDDHIGGLFYILTHFTVGEVLMGSIETDREAEKEFLELCEKRSIPVRRLYARDIIDLGGVALDVLHPPAGWSPHTGVNNQSLVFQLVWEDTAVLFTGDIEAQAEGAVSGTLCRSEILKVPHHGSRTSSSERFIAAVDPVDCVVSTGGGPGREAVDEAVLNRYRSHGARVWRTDKLGGIAVTFKEGRAVIEGTRQQKGYPCCKN